MWLLLLCTLARATLVDSVLFVVGERIVTVSDVRFEAELVARDPSPIPPFRDPTYALADRLVDIAIIRELAGEAHVYQPTSPDVRARFERFRSAWPNLDAWQHFLDRWGMDEERMQAFFFSRMVVERFVHRSVGLGVTASKGDERVYILAYNAWMADVRSRVTVRSPS